MIRKAMGNGKQNFISKDTSKGNFNRTKKLF